MALGEAEIRRRMEYKPPTDTTRPLHEQVGELTIGLALEMDRLLPDGREKAIVQTAIEEVRMRANQAIATHDWTTPAGPGKPLTG